MELVKIDSVLILIFTQSSFLAAIVPDGIEFFNTSTCKDAYFFDISNSEMTKD